MRNVFCKHSFYCKTVLSLYCLGSTVLGCIPIGAKQPDKPLALFIPCSYDPRLTDWLMSYLQTVTDDTPLEEVIDSILEYRAALMLQGYVMPQVSDLMPYFQANLKERGIDLPDEEYEFLKQEFIKRERRLSCEEDEIGVDLCRHRSHRHHEDKKDKKKDKWEFNFSKKSIFGLIKFCGGALTCLVPVPAAQGIGIFLMGDGVKDIIDDCRDREPDQAAEENKRLEKAIEAGGCP